MDSIPTTTPQQFCLRWHNHQASLLSSLPLLLDQSHLTDVTLSAEGRTVRAHRVVLSACSTYFSELFRTLEPPYHPIVVLPGTPFGALVALLTFMYSGEVNVFEEQISTLLALAETLGIKGLADFNGNLSKSSPKSDSSASAKDSTGTPERHPSTSPLSAQALHQKILSSSLDNLFCKSFPFYSNFMNQQPLNFSRSSSRSRNDINTSNNSNDNNNENRYQSPLNKKDNKHSNNFNCSSSSSNNNNNNNDNDDSKSKTNFNNNDSNNNNNNNNNNNGGGSYNNKKIKISENMRKIDKIAENLRIGNKLNGSGNNNNTSNTNNPNFDAKFPIHLPQAATSLMLKSPLHHFLSDENQSMIIPKTPENLFLDTPNHNNLNMLQQANELMAASHDLLPTSHLNNTHLDKNANNSTSSPIISHTSQVTNLLPPVTKPSNSKLYATCFICHKQLSNQYNLRVHLETHQNVRYACTVCTHVSRSKDALRKHVSYRHPGTPSPCDSETRRKRSKTNLANQQIKQELLNLEQHNNQLQQIIQSGQANQFTQLLSPAAVNSLANLNLSINAAAAAAAAAASSGHNNQNSNEVISSSAHNSPTTNPTAIKSELTATDSNENV